MLLFIRFFLGLFWVQAFVLLFRGLKPNIPFKTASVRVSTWRKVVLVLSITF